MTPYNLTICICAYNAEKYLPLTLESLYNQTFKHFILWVVDDGSSDRTKNIAEEFISSHGWEHAKVFSLPQNGGLANARKFAEERVETEFLGFFDADDIALPEYVEKQYQRLVADPSCMACGCYYEYIDASSRKIGGGIFLGARTKEEFLQRARNEKLIFQVASSIMRVAELRGAGGRNINGFPPGKPRYQDMCEDLDLWCRMSDRYKEGKYLVVVPEVLVQYRKIISSVSANSAAMSMRMRHIKCNLKRRRHGEPELTFIDYLASLTPWQKMKYAYSDWSQGFYKRAGFHYIQKHHLRFIWCFGCAALFNPKYFLQKMRYNVKRH